MPSSLGQHLHVWLIDVLRLCVWLAILAAIFVPLERLCAIRPSRILRKGVVVDLGYYFISSLLPAILLSAPLAALAWALHGVMPGEVLSAAASLPLWARMLAGLVASEIGYYWGHRLSHEIPFLWRFHAIHHSAETIDFLVNTRAHPVDMVFGRLCALIPLYVLGLAGPIDAQGSLVPVIVTLISTIWGFFIHANLRWRFGPLEWLVATPAFHHWHHTLSGPIDRNYASTLPILDRLFGTLHLPKTWPDAYGIAEPIPDSLLGQLTHPLRGRPGPATVRESPVADTAD